MTILINLLGQPSAGKSTTLADLFCTLKYQSKSVEMVTEWVKKYAWENRAIGAFDQYYIFGKEVNQQSRLINKVDYIISDSPVYLSAFYQQHYSDKTSLKEPVLDFYRALEQEGVTVYNFFLTRNKPYVAKGRYQTEMEASVVASELYNWLKDNGIPFETLNCQDKERVNQIIKRIGITNEETETIR